MKLQILSDQHVEFKKNFGYFCNRCYSRADTLVIAGDLHPHVDSITHSNFIKTYLLPKWKNVVYIPGNHEFYGSNSDDNFFGHAVKVFENEDGHKVYYCNNHVFEIDGIYFVCTTLWSHIGYERASLIQYQLSDYKNINGLTVDRINERHYFNKLFLDDAMNRIPDGKRCVIVTHHVPSYNLISPRWRSNKLNDAFSADMDMFIMMNGHRVSHWIHGHSHDEIDETINGIRFIRNPMGYPRERNCDMDFVIEV